MGYYDHWVTTFVMNLSVIYDIEKLSFSLSCIVEPEDPTFAEGIKIDDDAIFVQDDPFCDDPDIEEFSEMRGLGAMTLREKSLFTIRKHREDIKEEELGEGLWRAFEQLAPSKKQQFMCLCDD